MEATSEEMNKVFTLLTDYKVQDIVDRHNEIQKCKDRNSYNLFTLSTITSHRENFHSDIIASLLNPEERHGESNAFLNLFIDFLNGKYKSTLNILNYKNSIILRENGHIDIWIKDEKSHKAILIENKMNNADDREGQINDYHYFSETKAGYKVEAIIYLSLDGLKPLPHVRPEIEKLLINVGAFKNKNDDLVNGWLKPCLERSYENRDTFSLINQYIKLISHLSNKQMDNNTLDTFYNFVNENQSFETVNKINELSKLLPTHRTNKFVNEIKEIKPFTYSYRWQDNYMLYDYYVDGKNSFKMDIHFMETSGNASILFWNPPFNDEIGFSALTAKLAAISLLNEFGVYDSYKFIKYFTLGNPYKSLSEIDAAIIEFTKMFMEKLKESSAP